MTPFTTHLRYGVDERLLHPLPYSVTGNPLFPPANGMLRRFYPALSVFSSGGVSVVTSDRPPAIISGPNISSILIDRYGPSVFLRDWSVIFSLERTAILSLQIHGCHICLDVKNSKRIIDQRFYTVLKAVMMNCHCVERNQINKREIIFENNYL